MTAKQQEIHDGLKAIGPEIAAFYSDGIDLLKLDLKTKPYLLGHLAREIESGFRDILVNKDSGNPELCDCCSKPLHRKIGHKESIIKALGLENETKFTKQWYKIAKQFPKYAHRHGAWKPPREQTTFDQAWGQFEDILDFLVGNYYALADRLDVILNMEKPSKEALGTLHNLFSLEARTHYFFSNLKHRGWLIPLEKESYFDASKNPEPVEVENKPDHFWTPQWNALYYLDEVAQQNLSSPDAETSETLVRIVDGICSHTTPSGDRINNYYTDYITLKVICTLPKEYLKDNHFQFVESIVRSESSGLMGGNYDKFIERLIELDDKDLLMKGVKTLLKYRVLENSFEAVHSIFEDYDLKRLLSDYKEQLIPALGLDLLKLGIKKIDEIISIYDYAFNTITISTIEDNRQTYSTERYECQLTYLVRDTLEAVSSGEIADTLKDFLDREHPIFKRLAIHTIRMRYDDFKDVFWSLEENPLSFKFAKHETYELLKQHSENFDAIEVDLVIDWISSQQYYTDEEHNKDPKEAESYAARCKREWLTALPNGSEPVRKLTEELELIDNSKIKHPGYTSYSSGLVSGEISPISEDDLSVKSIEEVIEYYYEFKEQDHEFLGPSVSGLIHAFSLVVRKNSEKYIKNCHLIEQAPFPIQEAWMQGLLESRRSDNKGFDCEEVLETLNSIIEQPNFWKTSDNGNQKVCSFIKNILSFFMEGLSGRDKTFQINELPAVKRIILTIYRHDNCPVSNHQDISMTFINSSKGKLYLCFFMYSLTKIEHSENQQWDRDIKDIVSERVESGKNDPLLFHAIGRCLPNIHYLDQEWLLSSFDKLFPIGSADNWQAAIAGYFSNYPDQTKRILSYSLMVVTLRRHWK